MIISLDGPDSACEQIVSRFLADSRFRLVVQPERLGWFGNLNWLMRNVSGDFWVYHGQDDRTSENYIEALVEHADRHPEATLVYSDMIPFGQLTGRWKQPSVHGSTAFIRQMTPDLRALSRRCLSRIDPSSRTGASGRNPPEQLR